MNGLLVVDKPPGPSSHDVVARVRRILGERRIGHTGTLDPAASGVLPLLVGKATRLSQFMVTASKAYDAVVCLGVATNTFDAEGTPDGAAHAGALPGRNDVEQALAPFRGTFLQQPPVYSAKKIEGQPSYKRARRAEKTKARGAEPIEVPAPAPASVTVHALDVLEVDGDRVRLRIECSAGFYVRSLAHDLGRALGTGGHLAALRRTRSGESTLAHAVTLATLEAAGTGRQTAETALIPMEHMLPSLEVVVLTAQGVRRAVNGCELGPADTLSGLRAAAMVVGSGSVAVSRARLVSAEGALVGIASPGKTPGLLHPLVVLM